MNKKRSTRDMQYIVIILKIKLQPFPQFPSKNQTKLSTFLYPRDHQDSIRCESPICRKQHISHQQSKNNNINHYTISKHISYTSLRVYYIKTSTIKETKCKYLQMAKYETTNVTV